MEENKKPPEVALISIPLNEWNEQKSTLQEVKNLLKEMVNQEQKELLTPKEVCERLKISRSTFERYVINGVLEVVKIDKKKYSKNYVRRSYLEEQIKNGVI